MKTKKGRHFTCPLERKVIMATKLEKPVTRWKEFDEHNVKITLCADGLIFQKKNSRDKHLITWKEIMHFETVNPYNGHMKKLYVALGVSVEQNNLQKQEHKHDEIEKKETKKIKMDNKEIEKLKEYASEIRKMKRKLAKIKKLSS